jgi:hypothetical protein
MYLAEGSGSAGLLLHVQGQELHLTQLGEATAVGEQGEGGRSSEGWMHWGQLGASILYLQQNMHFMKPIGATSQDKIQLSFEQKLVRPHHS